MYVELPKESSPVHELGLERASKYTSLSEGARDPQRNCASRGEGIVVMWIAG